VLLRKPRSEVATRMSDVVMRTRQLRRRTKDKAAAAVGAVDKGKRDKVELAAEGATAPDERSDEAGGVSPLRLVVGERVEQRDSRRTRHNSPLARNYASGSR